MAQDASGEWQAAAASCDELFCTHLQRLGIEQVLDLGGSPSFGSRLRRQGYRGVLFSVQSNAGSYRELLSRAQADPGWFPLARQSAGAGRYFMQLDGERVFVQPAAQLLRADVMREIEALRLDAQALRAGALDGYLPLLERVRLILIEGASDGLEARGFVPESSPTEVLRPGARVLTRASPIPAGRRRTGISLAAVVTSIGGKIERRLPDGSDLGPLWLQSCLHSWRATGAAVVSVAEREPPQGIHWARTQTRPSLAQMLAAAPMAPDQHLLLTNADIVLTDALPALFGRLQGQAVYYGSRLDVERGSDAQSGLAPRGVYELGFDYFLLPEPFVRCLLADGLLPAQLRIGEPWWDYLLPILALARGFPVKKLGGGPVLAMHYVHPARYSTEVWVRNRDLFIQVCTRLLGETDCYASGVLTELLAHLDQIPHLVCRCLP